MRGRSVDGSSNSNWPGSTGYRGNSGVSGDRSGPGHICRLIHFSSSDPRVEIGPRALTSGFRPVTFSSLGIKVEGDKSL